MASTRSLAELEAHGYATSWTTTGPPPDMDETNQPRTPDYLRLPPHPCRSQRQHRRFLSLLKLLKILGHMRPGQLAAAGFVGCGLWDQGKLRLFRVYLPSF